MNTENPPLVVMVAPNGARRTHADHPALPISPAELAETAAACRDAGAAAIHLHVRDRDNRHTLDPDIYRAAIAAIRQAVGKDLIVQATTEAVGIYGPDEQMAAMRALKPEAVSLAVRELRPDAAHEREFGKFLEWLAKERILPQFILYSAEDVLQFRELHQRGLIPFEKPWQLFVLGRYTPGQVSQPTDLLAFLQVAELRWPWSVCAFGAREHACGLTAACLDGHVRVGFENNLQLADGGTAPDNAALIAQIAIGAQMLNRPLADAHRARELLSG